VNEVPSAWAKCALFLAMIAASSSFRVSMTFVVDFFDYFASAWVDVGGSGNNFDLRECRAGLWFDGSCDPFENLSILELSVYIFNGLVHVGGRR
jgi:hypothetical protein